MTRFFHVAPQMLAQARAFAQWQQDSPIEFSDRNMDDLSAYEVGLLANIGCPEGWGLLSLDDKGRLFVEDEDGEQIQLVLASK